MSDFIHASHERPCPVCGGKKSCSWKRDGLAFCHRRHGEPVPGWLFMGRSEGPNDWGKYLPEAVASRKGGATPSSPCPVCGQGGPGCSWTDDGLHVCQARVPGDRVPGWKCLGTSRIDRKGLWRREGDARRGGGRRPRPPRDQWADGTGGDTPQSEEKPRLDYPALARERHEAAVRGGLLAKLAEKMGVAADALAALGVGFGTVRYYLRPFWDGADQLHWERKSIKGNFWNFPEKDADGSISGNKVRLPDNEQRYESGSSPGLYFADGWDVRPGPVLLVEGGSDTAACLTMGLCVVGRPSATGGVKELLKILANVPDERAIVVVAERDGRWDKGKWHWPGLEGAKRTAAALEEGLGRRVLWALPPGDAKDTRAWLLAQRPDIGSPEGLAALGNAYVQQLLAGAEKAEYPTQEVPPDQQPDGSDVTPCAATDLAQDCREISLEEKNTTTPGTPPQAPAHKRIPDTIDLKAIDDNDLRLDQSRRTLSNCDGRPCPALHWVQLGHNKMPARGLGVGVRCRRWSCVVCVQFQRALWSDHLWDALRAHPGPLHVWHGTERRWQAAMRAAQRAGGEHCRVARPKGRVLAVLSVPVKGASQASPEEAAEAVVAAISAIRKRPTPKRGSAKKGTHPVSASRGWKLPHESPRLWWRVGSFAHPAQSLAVLRSMGVAVAGPADKAEGRSADGLQGRAYLSYPPGWGNDHIRWAHRWAVAQTVPPGWRAGDLPGDPWPLCDALLESAAHQFFGGVLTVPQPAHATPTPPAPAPGPSPTPAAGQGWLPLARSREARLDPDGRWRVVEYAPGGGALRWSRRAYRSKEAAERVLAGGGYMLAPEGTYPERVYYAPEPRAADVVQPATGPPAVPPTGDSGDAPGEQGAAPENPG